MAVNAEITAESAPASGSLAGDMFELGNVGWPVCPTTRTIAGRFQKPRRPWFCGWLHSSLFISAFKAHFTAKITENALFCSELW